VEDRGVLKESSCIEPSVEDTTLNVRSFLVNEKMTKGEYVAGKKLCNVAVEDNGPQQEVSPLQPNVTEQGVYSTVSVSPFPTHGNDVDHENFYAPTEENSKTLGKARKWKRKPRDSTSDSICETKRKRNFEDVVWTQSDGQETQLKRSNTRGEIPSHFDKAVAESQPRLSL
jgi:hypothetical protein